MAKTTSARSSPRGVISRLPGTSPNDHDENCAYQSVLALTIAAASSFGAEYPGAVGIEPLHRFGHRLGIGPQIFVAHQALDRLGCRRPSARVRRPRSLAAAGAGAAGWACAATGSPPGTNSKRSSSEPCSHGRWASPVSETTSRRTAIIRSLMLWPGSAICLSSAVAKGELRPAPSMATEPGAVEKAMNEPRVELNCASPASAAADRLVAVRFSLRTNGLLRQASRNTRLVVGLLFHDVEDVVDLHRFEPKLGRHVEPGIDRHDEVAAVDLQAVAGIVEQPDAGAVERIGERADLAFERRACRDRCPRSPRSRDRAAWPRYRRHR